MNQSSNSAAKPGPPRRFMSDGRLIVGRLEAHGPAKYQFRADQSPSYFLKVLTNRGMRILWGADFARALKESRTHPKLGTMVGVRRTGYEAFSIPERTRNAAGQAIETRRLVKRTRWMIETAQFFAERAQLARRLRDAHADVRATTQGHPELVSTFLSLRSAKAIAERRIADPRDRERFLALVREAMAKSIHNGDPLPDVRLHARSQHAGTRTGRGPPGRDEPTR